MAEFKLRIDMENAAFEGPDGYKVELNALLNEVALKVALGKSEGAVLDRNGNRVGEWEVA